MPNPKWQRWKGIMKAQPFEEKRLERWQPPYIVQPKYDGIRCRAVPLPAAGGGGHLLLSSEENPIFLSHIQDALRRNEQFNNLELDGEIYRHTWPFEQIFGVASRTVNPHPDAHLLQFHIFDINLTTDKKKKILQDCCNLLCAEYENKRYRIVHQCSH